MMAEELIELITHLAAGSAYKTSRTPEETELEYIQRHIRELLAYDRELRANDYRSGYEKAREELGTARPEDEQSILDAVRDWATGGDSAMPIFAILDAAGKLYAPKPEPPPPTLEDLREREHEAVDAFLAARHVDPRESPYSFLRDAHKAVKDAES